jgi:hypothetical protein
VRAERGIRQSTRKWRPMRRGVGRILKINWFDGVFNAAVLNRIVIRNCISGKT